MIIIGCNFILAYILPSNLSMYVRVYVRMYVCMYEDVRISRLVISNRRPSRQPPFCADVEELYARTVPCNCHGYHSMVDSPGQFLV